MLSRILPGGSITLALWAVLVFMTRRIHGRPDIIDISESGTSAKKLGKGFGLLAILYGLLLFLGASLTGGSNPLKPLATVSFGWRRDGCRGISTSNSSASRPVDDLDREIAAAVRGRQNCNARLLRGLVCVLYRDGGIHVHGCRVSKLSLSNTVIATG